jgi:hypothetical protein
MGEKCCNKNEMTHVSYKSKELHYKCNDDQKCTNTPLNFIVEFERTNYYNPNWSKKSIIIPILGVYMVNVSFNITKVINGGTFDVLSCLKLNNDFLIVSNIAVNLDTTGFTCENPSSYRINNANLLFDKNDKLSVNLKITYDNGSPIDLNYYMLISLLRVG